MIGTIAQPASPLSLLGGGQPDANVSNLPVEFIALLAKLNGVPGTGSPATVPSATPVSTDVSETPAQTTPGNAVPRLTIGFTPPLIHPVYPAPAADPATATVAARVPAAPPVLSAVAQIPVDTALATETDRDAAPRLPAGFTAPPARPDFVATPTLSATPIAVPANLPAIAGEPVLEARTSIGQNTGEATGNARLRLPVAPAAPPVTPAFITATVMPAIPPEPAAALTPVEATAEIEEDSGPVPDGLEEIADTLASALAAVFAAAGKTVTLAFGRPTDEVQAPAPAPISAPAQSPLLTIVPPMTIDPEIVGKDAKPGMPFVVANLEPLTKPDPAVPLAIEPALPDQPESAADAPELPPLAPLPASAPTTASIPATTATAPAPMEAPAPASASEIVMDHHLDLAKDGEWLDRLARDIARAAGNDAQLRFQLNPEHLGSLRVELANTADGTTIRLTADTEAARTALVDAQPRLVAEARAQGLRISESHVDMGGQGGQQRGGHESRQPFVRILQPGDEPQAQSPRSAAERFA